MSSIVIRVRHGRDCMLVGYTTTCAISPYLCTWYNIMW